MGAVDGDSAQSLFGSARVRAPALPRAPSAGALDDRPRMLPAVPHVSEATMGKLIYLLNVSLDGFVETADRSLDWTVVDDELHTWFNEQTRSLDASLYGRRLG